MSAFRPALERALHHALDYLDGLPTASVAATVTREQLLGRLQLPLAAEGCEPERVIDELVAAAAGGQLGSAGGRFFAWVISGSLPAALAADWLTSAWDQNSCLFSSSPANSVIEEVAGEWLKQALRLPSTASFAFTTGCQMAHVTCLAAARHQLLARQGWDVERQGLAGAPPLTLLSSSERHGSIERAARLLGLGSDSLVQLPVDPDGRLEPDVLQSALQNVAGPVIVVLQAGDINIGAFDPFDKLIPLAHAAGAWVHVDGAFGLWVNASPRLRPLLAGVEAADSWATDGHKWLNVPYDSGFAFVAHPDSHRNAMGHRASYLTHAEDARDQLDWTPEWSRRGRGVPVYAALRELGSNGLADLVERCCAHARALVAGIGDMEGAEVLWEPSINQGLVRFLAPGSQRNEDHDALTMTMLERVNAGGEAFFSPTTWRGQRCWRVSVCSWRTRTEDVERTLASVRSAWEQLQFELRS